MDAVECVVVGAGIVGLAIARALAQSGREVIVLERSGGIGSETSSRNSEVIHSGIYYPKGSLKAKTCVSGRKRLYRYCREHGVPHKKLGKLIVACKEEEIARLEGLAAAGAANEVEELAWLSAQEALSLEPEIRCVAALLSPQTGIIDSHALMLSFEAEAESRGAVIAFASPLLYGRVSGSGFELSIGGAEPSVLFSEILVNSAGLYAPAVARSIEGLPKESIPREYFCRGVYYTLSGRSPFRRLIYPVPPAGGLGVHVTLDLAGAARFGPDVEWITSIDYAVDAARAPSFYRAVRTYWPGLGDGALQPGYAGVRPKISGPGEPAADFVVQGAEAHGVSGLVNLYGIESPGLTSALALADEVMARLDGGEKC